MSEPLAVVSVVGLVLGTAAVTALGLAAMVRNRALHLKVSRRGVDLTVEAGPGEPEAHP